MSGAYDNLMRPLHVGHTTLKNRVFMAPMTRIRASDDHTPTALMETYYAQCAGFGLILTEPTMVQRGYSAYGYEPAIYSKSQGDGWQRVTDAVHDAGGSIFLMLSHGGRMTTPSCVTLPHLSVMGPSERGVPPGCSERRSAAFDRKGEEQPFPEHVHKMTVEEIHTVQECFVRSARNAMAVGFDGVELDAGHGYLIDQFLRDGCNDRTDEYGGSVENRCRFLFEVVDAVIAAIGKEHVSVRISPESGYNAMSDSDPIGLLQYLLPALDERRIAFLDVAGDGPEGTYSAESSMNLAQCVRANYTGVLVLGGGFTPERAEEAVLSGAADAVAFAGIAVANPDLVQRLAVGAPLNTVNVKTIVGRGAEGYTDYPLLSRPGVAPAAAAGDATTPAPPTGRAESWTRVDGAPTPFPVGSRTPTDKLLRPLLLHQLPCKNRMIMGPLPRQRADAAHVPTPLMVEYYAARSSMGLIVSEPVEIQPGYHTYVRGPCIFTRAQVEGWRKVTDAVHAKGGAIFCQLHHGGRAVAACNLEPFDYSADSSSSTGDAGEHSWMGGEESVGGSQMSAAAIQVKVTGASTHPVPAGILCPSAFAKSGEEVPYPQDVVAMRRSMIAWLVKLYASAARKAIAAGFDGVEVQASNGYLIDQFLRDGCNDRADEYGGSVENRCRFLFEVVDAVIAAIGKERVGVRVSPTDPTLGMQESNVPVLCRTIASELQRRDVAYIAITNDPELRALKLMRPLFYKGAIAVDAPESWRTTFGDCEDMLGEERYRPQAEAGAEVAAGGVHGEFDDLAPPPNDHFAPDAITFLLPMVANPDLADRAVHGLPFTLETGALLFTHDDVGYNDYPTYKEERRRERLAAVASREQAALEEEQRKAQLQQGGAADSSENGAEVSENAEASVNEVHDALPKTHTRVSNPRRVSTTQVTENDQNSSPIV